LRVCLSDQPLFFPFVALHRMAELFLIVGSRTIGFIMGARL